MNLGELIDDFRVSADDQREPYLFSRSNLVAWFNEAEEEAAIRGKLIFDKTSAATELTLASGESVIELDESVIEIEYARLVDSAGDSYRLTISDRIEQDRLEPDWRTLTDQPDAIIHDDKQVEFNRLADDDYTVNLEIYRGPAQPMAESDDSPEIHKAHHRYLKGWVEYRAYGVPDSDAFDAERSAAGLAKFEDYFGKRPDSSIRRRQQANRPHFNKAHF